MQRPNRWDTKDTQRKYTVNAKGIQRKCKGEMKGMEGGYECNTQENKVTRKGMQRKSKGDT